MSGETGPAKPAKAKRNDARMTSLSGTIKAEPSLWTAAGAVYAARRLAASRAL
jgi:hypothetical protein